MLWLPAKQAVLKSYMSMLSILLLPDNKDQDSIDHETLNLNSKKMTNFQTKIKSA